MVSARSRTAGSLRRQDARRQMQLLYTARGGVWELPAVYARSTTVA
jgi:hypothetical protein